MLPDESVEHWKGMWASKKTECDNLADELDAARKVIAEWRDGVGRRCCDHTRAINDSLRVDKGVLTAERDIAKSELEKTRSEFDELKRYIDHQANIIKELKTWVDLVIKNASDELLHDVPPVVVSESGMYTPTLHYNEIRGKLALVRSIVNELLKELKKKETNE